MKIFGLEIKRINKDDIPKKPARDIYCSKTDISDKGREYLLGLKGGPFTIKKGQGYCHYDGLKIANNRVHFMWRGDEIISQDIFGPCAVGPLVIMGITGKQKVHFT